MTSEQIIYLIVGTIAGNVTGIILGTFVIIPVIDKLMRRKK